MASEGEWFGPPAGDSILADVQKMIVTLQADRAYGPYTLIVPLSRLNSLTTARLRRLLAESDDVPLKNYVYNILLKRKRR